MEKQLRLLALAGSAIPGIALAQEGPAGAKVDPDRIIVTGERTARTQADTATSVVVLSGNEADKASADRLDQLLLLVPNVQLGTGEEAPAIRGQDATGQLRNLFAFLGGARPRVTMQVDGRPASFYEFVSGSQSAWDIAQVEVFRSPQTTTQGRNSIAGAIFVTTRAPTDEWEGRARAIMGDFDTRQFSVALSGPVVKNELTVRVSGDLRFSRVASDMTDAIAGVDIDRDDYGTGRIKLRYQPESLPGASLETTLAYTKSQAPQFEGVSRPFENRRLPVPNQMVGVMRVEATSLTAKARYPLSDKLDLTVTGSHGDALLRRFGLPGLGNTRADSTDYSVEPILHWRPKAEFDLIFGTNTIATDQVQSIDITGLGIGTGSFDDQQDSLGVFGEGTWRPVAGFSLTAGLRYQRDRQVRFGKVGAIVLDYDRSFDAWLPKVSASYEFMPDFTLGMLVQRAYNPGGVSLSLRRRAADDFLSERLWNYEVFLRAATPDGQLRFNANAFYNDIRDAQRSQLVPITLPDGTTTLASEFSNAPKARTYGLETELSWRVRQGLSLRFGMGFLDTRVRETVRPNDRSLGKDFQRSPKVSAVGAIDWQLLEGLNLSALVRYRTSYYSEDTNRESQKIGAATVVDARAAYEIGGLTVFGYARNLFDNFYMTYLIDSNFGTAGDPQELGIGVEARF